MSNVVTVFDICGNITAALSAASTVERAEDHDELTEGVHDTPLLQVYPDNSALVSVGSGTDKLTFGATGDIPEREEQIGIIADYFAAHRAHLGQDMGRLVAGIDAIRSVLKDQNTCPPFDIADVNSFQWRWERVTFEFGGIKYIAARFYITLRMAA